MAGKGIGLLAEDLRLRLRYRRSRSAPAPGGWLDTLRLRPAAIVPLAADGVVSLMGHDFDLTNPQVWAHIPDQDELWPRQFFRKFDFLNEPICDCRLIWQLGRLQSVPGLLAHDPAAGRRVLTSYLNYDRPFRTVYWFSEMDLGIRMISLMWCAMLIEPGDSLRRRIVEHLGRSYHFLRDHLTTWWNWSLRSPPLPAAMASNTFAFAAPTCRTGPTGGSSKAGIPGGTTAGRPSPV